MDKSESGNNSWNKNTLINNAISIVLKSAGFKIISPGPLSSFCPAW